MTRHPATRRAHLGRRGRRRVMTAGVLAVIAVVVAVVGILGAARARPVPDDAERTALLSATDEAVTALLTFTPDPAEADRAAVAARLADPLAETYRASGADVVLPGAVEARASMSSRVVGAGVEEFRTDRARVLVFVDQTVVLPGTAGTGDRAPIARWAIMRNVENNWLLADLELVGDVTR